jgi:hypothetical protein
MEVVRRPDAAGDEPGRGRGSTQPLELAQEAAREDVHQKQRGRGQPGQEALQAGLLERFRRGEGGNPDLPRPGGERGGPEEGAVSEPGEHRQAAKDVPVPAAQAVVVEDA